MGRTYYWVLLGITGSKGRHLSSTDVEGLPVRREDPCLNRFGSEGLVSFFVSDMFLLHSLSTRPVVST